MTDSIPKISHVEARNWFANLPTEDFLNKRILLIVGGISASTVSNSINANAGGHPGAPGLRSSPPYEESLPLIFDAFFQTVRPLCLAFDVLMALGDAPPLSDSQISKLLGIGESERGRLFFQTQFFNHDPDRSDRLVEIGTLKAAVCAELTQGLFASDIPIQINSRVTDYDLLVVVSPVFPDPSLGFSGGNACFFPGLGGRQILDAIERLCTAASDDKLIGVKQTPSRKIADAASRLIPQMRRAITFVAKAHGTLCGLFYDTPESAWNAAADLSIKYQ